MELQSFLFQLYFALVSAYLSIVLYRVLKQNGRIMKEMTEGFEKMSKEMREGFEKMGEKITEAFKATWEKMDETNKLIARLIVEENEKTRKEILNALSK